MTWDFVFIILDNSYYLLNIVSAIINAKNRSGFHMSINTFLIYGSQILDSKTVGKKSEQWSNSKFLSEPMHKDFICARFPKCLAFFSDFTWFYLDTNKKVHFSSCHQHLI